jgi:hypothetical protein
MKMILVKETKIKHYAWQNFKSFVLMISLVSPIVLMISLVSPIVLMISLVSPILLLQAFIFLFLTH